MFPLCASLKTSCSLKNLSSNSDEDDNTTCSVNHIDKLLLNHRNNKLNKIQNTNLKKTLASTSSKSLFVKFIRKKFINGFSKYFFF